MNKTRAFSISVTLILMVIVALPSCAHIPTAQQPTLASAPPVVTAEQHTDSRTVTFEQPRLKVRIEEWWPIEVVNVIEVKKGTQNGDRIIEIRNVSDKPIEAIRLLLGPPSCDAFVMSPGLWVGFGRDDPYFIKPLTLTLKIGESCQLTVEGKRLDVYFPLKILEGCPLENSYFYLYLERVKYADGTVWKARKDPDDPNQEIN